MKVINFMKTLQRGIIGVAALLLASAVQLFAIEGLKLSIHCPDVWLSWPSVEGETYIVQHRGTLDTNSTWVTLTNALPAASGTNLTTFVHCNQVDCPTGQIFGMMFSGDGQSGAASLGGESEQKESKATEPMVIPKDGSEGPVPLGIYPPGMDLSGYIIIWPDGSTDEWSKELVEKYEAIKEPDQGDPQPEDCGGGGSQGSGFYRVVRNGVHFFGLTNETTLSGTVNLPVEAGYVDLESTLEILTLSANGLPVDGLFPLAQPFSYPISFALDTTRLNNGTYYLQASGWWRRAVLTNTYESPTLKFDGVNGDSVSVNVSNNICYPDWITDVGETNMMFKITSLYTNIEWRVDVYGAAGDYIRSFTNHSDDGLIDFAWDLLDTNGVARNDLVFTSVTSVTNSASGASATSTNARSIRRVDNYPAEGRWVVCRADIIPHDFANFGLFTNAINTIAAMGEQAGGVLPATNRNFGEAYVVRVGNINDWRRVFQSFTNNARNFYWFGHGSPNTIADGETSIAASDVADFLNNTAAPGTNNTRYRFVWIDACAGALGSWPATFALGNTENRALANYTVRPGAFCAYTQNVYGYGGHTSVTAAAANYRSAFVFWWKDLNRGVHSAFDHARDDSGFNAAAQYLKIYGYWDLGWRQYNTKGEWP